MKKLSLAEVQEINGGKIYPSEWVPGAAIGTMVGAVCSIVSRFSTKEIDLIYGMAAGGGLGLGFSVIYSMLREFERHF